MLVRECYAIYLLTSGIYIVYVSREFKIGLEFPLFNGLPMKTQIVIIILCMTLPALYVFFISLA